MINKSQCNKRHNLSRTHILFHVLVLLSIVIGFGHTSTHANQSLPKPFATNLSPIVVSGSQLYTAQNWQPFEVRGVNYTHMLSTKPNECTDFQFGVFGHCPLNMTVVGQDMDRLRAYGVNTIRIFLNFYSFGGFRISYPQYSTNPALNQLEQFISIANSRNIYVLPVLLAKYPQDSHFDAEDFSVALNLHVHPIVQRFANHPGILGWDMFNEPDIAGPVDIRCWDWDNGDFPLCFHVATQRLLFLNMLTDEIRKLDPVKPVTVSVAFAKSYFRPYNAYTVRLADLVDFYAIHYYDNDPYDCGRYAQHWYYGQGFPKDLERSIDELTILNLNKPTVITEVGFPSGTDTFRTTEDTWRDLKVVMQISRNKHISGIILWPFQTQPEELVNDLFW